MNIFVTGATGFIGSAFTKLARARGHRVAGLVRPETPWRQQDEDVDLIRLEGTLTEPPWREIEKFAPETCVHAAWIATPGTYLDAAQNENYLRWSIEFAQNLTARGLRRFVGLGTCIEYQIDAATRKPLSEEETPIVPVSLYAKCKNEFRLALEQRFDLAWCWGRIFYPYGPGEHPDRLCSSLIRKLRDGKAVGLRTPGNTKDYIYIHDLAEAILLLVTKSYTGAINLGTGEGVTVREIARTVGELLNRAELIDEDEDPSTTDPYGHVVADAKKLRSLGWSPTTSLRDGLRRLAATVA